MPRLNLPVPETQSNIFRPVVFSIMKDLQRLTNIPPQANILFPGTEEQVAQKGTAIGENDRQIVQYPYSDNIKITAQEEYDKDRILSTATQRPEHKLIFLDDNLGVLMKPIYSDNDHTLTFDFRSKSKALSRKWRDEIRTRVSMMRDVFYHTVSFHYMIPVEFLTILQAIHALRENNLGYGEDFEHWFTNNSTNRLTTITNQAGEHTSYVIAEVQTRVIGYFDFPEAPDKAQKENEADAYTTNVVYKFKFSKPIEVCLQYPIMIHNQILDDKYRVTNEVPNEDKKMLGFSYSAKSLYKFEKMYQLDELINNRLYVHLPKEDEFIPNNIQLGTVAVWSALCQIEDDKRTLLNLNELGDLMFDEEILQWIKDVEYPYITQPYQSLIQVQLYRSMYQASQSCIECTNEGIIKATSDLDLRKNHRVRFSLLCNFTYLNKETIKRVQKYPSVMAKLLRAIDECLKNNPGYFDLMRRSHLTLDDLALFYPNDPNIIQHRRDSLSDRYGPMKTVMTAGILAMRKKDVTDAPVVLPRIKGVIDGNSL